MNSAPPRGRQQLLLLTALFFAPLIAAVLLYFVLPDLQPDSRTNYGELIDPARPLPDAPLLGADGTRAVADVLRGRWSFIFVGGSDCDDACAEKLYQIRQIRTLLNEKRQRVQRVYLAPDVEALAAAQLLLAERHPDLRYLADTPQADYRRFFGDGDARALYLVDPLGNWLMRYPGNADSKGILKDIKKLLRLSQIG
jgi:cytochrome oxidase Cu insertion factor (SCO1/SenC/PrrC family)